MSMNGSLTLAIVVLASTTALADEVYLKGGGRVSGRVLSRTATSVEIEVGAGKIAVPANTVERIVEGRSTLDVYYERAGALDPKDRKGWSALGGWASDQGLSNQAREAYNRVLALDPSDAEANEALGNLQVDGRWMTEEQGYRARGYVQLEGEWMTPAEQQELQRERARADSDRARVGAEARARQAEAQAQEAETRAKEAAAAQQDQQGLPLWWGWGPGPVLWPAQPVVPAPQPGTPSGPVRRPR